MEGLVRCLIRTIIYHASVKYNTIQAMRKGQPANGEPSIRQRKLAHGYLHEGKSFRKAAAEAGYSPKTGALGPTRLRRTCPGINIAFIEAAKTQVWSPEDLKAMSQSRLVSDISSGKSSGVAREIETLGKFKDTDWFVRNTDVQIGVFASLADDSKVASSVEDLTAVLPALPTDTKEDK